MPKTKLKQDTRRMTKQNVFRLLELGDVDLLNTMNNPSFGFENFIQNQGYLSQDGQIDFEIFDLIMKAVCRICNLRHWSFLDRVQQFLNMLTSYEKFLYEVIFCVIYESLDHEQCIDLASFTKNYIIVIKTIFKLNLGTTQEIIDYALPGLQNILNEIKNRQINSFKEVQREYDILKRLVDKHEESFLPFEVEDEADSFRQLSIMPNDSDVIDCAVPDLPCNKVDGPYDSVNHYLSVHFRLIREDMIRTFIDCTKQRLTPIECHTSGCQMYEQVNIHLPHTYSPKGICYEITIQTNKPIDLSKKILMRGNIVCLMKNNYTSLVFAVISEQPRAIKNQSFEYDAEIRIDDTCDELFEADVNYLMFEMNAYFESYKHVLSAIKEFDENSFPLSDFLLYFDFQNSEPDYLVNSGNFFDLQYCLHEKCDGFGNNVKTQIQGNEYDQLSVCFDSICHQLPSISKNQKSSSSNTKRCSSAAQNTVLCPCKKFNPLDYANWPTSKELDMDDQQFKAFQTALTKKVAVVQGAPGTGKTFIGVKVVKALLQNISITPIPIVVCCLTNHVLDQFLEHISKFTKKFVRLGTQSKNINVQPYALDNLRIAYDIHSRGNGMVEMHTIYKRSLDHIWSFMPELLKDKPTPVWDPHLKKINDVSRRLNNLYDNLYLCQDEYLKESVLEQMVNINHKKQLLEGSKTNSQLLSTCILEWLCCSRNNTLYETCKKRFQRLRNSTIEDAIPNINLWVLPLNIRFELFFLWRKKYISGLLHKITKAKTGYKKLRTMGSTTVNGRTPDPVEIEILKKSHLIAVTTTDAAKFRNLLRSVNPNILIVVEAAAILESHIISLLLPTTQHLILIGDQIQSSPLAAHNELSEVYNLKISMFERLFRNGAPLATLVSQHRMKPCIAELLVQEKLYPDLKSYQNVYKYKDIKGINSNVFFLNHNKVENRMSSSTSFSNDYEAKIIVMLAKYFTVMSYSEEQITILAAYAAQVVLIQGYLEEINLSVFVTTVDNYQGEENDIVLLSFVRSNAFRFIGCLKENNRVCVALSRAKKGMFCVGNFSSYSFRSPLWKSIVKKLEYQNKIGPKIPLVCYKHGKQIVVEYPKDIRKLITSGCGEDCTFKLTCDHICSNKCHYSDQEHINYKCELPCEMYITETQKCPNMCFEPCKKIKNAVLLSCGHPAKLGNNDATAPMCGEDITKLLPCDHEDKIPCGTNVSLYKCQRMVYEDLPCGHKKNVVCHKSNGSFNFICNVLTPRTSPCGHTVHVPCSLELQPSELLTFCTMPCDQLLNCGHACPGNCCWCSGTGIHAQCKEKCSNMLECGHLCSGFCGTPCPLCENKCLLSCSHNMECINKCSRPCSPCEKECERRCIHGACTNKCSEPCSVEPCSLSCKEKLPCGHDCIGLCGDPCPSLCRVCHLNELTPENTLSGTYVKLDDCGHIIERDALQEHIDEALDNYLWPDCPECKQPIQKSLRYKDKLLEAKSTVLHQSDNYREIQTICDVLNSMNSPETLLPLEFRDIPEKVYDILQDYENPSTALVYSIRHCLVFLKDLLSVYQNLKETEASQQTITFHICFETLFLWVLNNLTCASFQQIEEVGKAINALKINLGLVPIEE